jgi:hypothetical protein
MQNIDIRQVLVQLAEGEAEFKASELMVEHIVEPFRVIARARQWRVADRPRRSIRLDSALLGEKLSATGLMHRAIDAAVIPVFRVGEFLLSPNCFADTKQCAFGFCEILHTPSLFPKRTYLHSL